MPQDSFREYVRDQLQGLAQLRFQAMFGGAGLYQADRFFGILMEGRLYFKTDAQSQAAYLQRGMAPFTYEKGRRIISLNYFEVPAEVLENRDELMVWARRAIRAACDSAESSQ